MKKVLIDADYLLQSYADHAVRALEFATTAPDLESRLKAIGAKEAFDALIEGLQEKMRQIQAQTDPAGGEESGGAGRN